MTDLVPTDERPRRVKPPGSGRKKGQKNRPITFAADAVRPLIPLARRRLRQLLHSENEEIVYKTATRILEHAYGRPMQHKVVGGDGQAPIKTETVRPDDRELAARIQMALEPPNKPAKDPPVSRLPRSRPSVEVLPPPSEEPLRIGMEIPLPEGAMAVLVSVSTPDVGTWEVKGSDGAKIKSLSSLSLDELDEWATAAAEGGRLS